MARRCQVSARPSWLLLFALIVPALLLPLASCRQPAEDPAPDPPPEPPIKIGVDGELLYLTVDGDLTLLRLGNTPGPATTVLREGLPRYTSWAWSPDGKAYALSLPTHGVEDHDVLVYSVESGELLHETRGFSSFGIGTVEWPAKGSFFTLDTGSGFGSSLDLFRLGQPDPVASIGYQGRYSWSPDARMIAYCAPRALESPNPWEATEAGGTGDLAVYLVETGETTTLIKGTGEYMYYPMAWLAVDRLLVGRLASDPEAPLRTAYFECGLDQPRDLSPIETLPPHLDYKFVAGLLPPERQETARRTGSYAWTADRSYVAVALRAETGRFEIWVVSADGTEACKVVDNAEGGGRPLWRPTSGADTP